MNIAMGSLQGPLFANIFMCSIESKLEQANKIPPMYRCFVDDTLVMMPNKEKANEFLHVLNNLHKNIAFTMEVESNNSIPFLGMHITKFDGKLETQVYRKPTNNGLLLHFPSLVDNRYKKYLVNTKVVCILCQDLGSLCHSSEDWYQFCCFMVICLFEMYS